MARLFNKTQNKIITSDLDIADTFLKRLKGYMFKENIKETEALLIPYCNSVHTFFMNFNIDLLFLDKTDRVKKIVRNLKPQKIILPVLNTNKVVELPSGAAEKNKIEIGDILYVET